MKLVKCSRVGGVKSGSRSASVSRAMDSGAELSLKVVPGHYRDACVEPSSVLSGLCESLCTV